MSSDESAGGGQKRARCEHGGQRGSCLICFQELQERLPKALAECLEAHGITEPADKLATLLGMGIGGLARLGADRENTLQACRQAYDKAAAEG